MTQLLVRYADGIFWLARYLERIENLARILDVTETFSRDRNHSNWMSVVQINADEKRFLDSHGRADDRTVPHFYILDQTNPTSIMFAMQAARENARTLRSLISIEMWNHINRMNTWMQGLTADDIAGPNLSRLCGEIKEACQAHAGITEGTCYRDAAYTFYMLGKYVERADQTTRLLDIKYHTLLPHVADIGSPLDVSQWNAVLRATAGYQAFRRVMSGRITPTSVAGFLLLSDAFPRSVVLCVRQMDRLLHQLRANHSLRGGVAALEMLDELRAALTDQSAEQMIARGLHEFIDWTQGKLTDITSEILGSFG